MAVLVIAHLCGRKRVWENRHFIDHPIEGAAWIGFCIISDVPVVSRRTAVWGIALVAEC